MNKQTLTFNSYAPLGQLVITRNGEIESSHTEALESDMRKQALKYIGNKTIEAISDATYVTASAIGMSLVRMFHDLDSTYVEAVIDEPVVAQSRNSLGRFE